MLVPDAVFERLISDGQLLIIAPRRRTTEEVTYTKLPDTPGPRIFVVVTIDWTVERLSWPEALQTVRRILGSALVRWAKLLAIPHGPAGCLEKTRGCGQRTTGPAN